MNKTLSTLIGTSVLAAGLSVMMISPAQAALNPDTLEFMSCIGTDYDISGYVTPTKDCTIALNVDQDFLNTDPMTVNVPEGFFGVTDWIYREKYDIPDDNSDQQSGTWDISLLLKDIVAKDILLVFRDGNDTSLVGYLLADGATSFEWESPFVAPPFSFSGEGPRDISHISIYYTPGDPVPEPGTTAALGLFALTSLGLIKKSRKG